MKPDSQAAMLHVAATHLLNTYYMWHMTTEWICAAQDEWQGKEADRYCFITKVHRKRRNKLQISATYAGVQRSILSSRGCHIDLRKGFKEI